MLAIAGNTIQRAYSAKEMENKARYHDIDGIADQQCAD